MSSKIEKLYPYSTENNLQNRQNYHYSVYGGKEFLKSYKENRNYYLQENKIEFSNNKIEVNVKERFNKFEIKENEYFNLKIFLFSSLCLCFENKEEQIDTHSISKIIKTFEVRKRLYNFYTNNIRLTPLNVNDYNDLENYELLSVLFCHLYEYKNNFQILSSLMKLNDILVSLKVNSILSVYSINKEIQFFDELMEIKGVVL